MLCSRLFGRSLASPARRTGSALVLVMVVLGLGFVLAFALLESQTAYLFLQRNAVQLDQARQAALSGVSAALQHIRDSQWSGVGTSFRQKISSTQEFVVFYDQGDPLLTPGHPQYHLWPYRVTITVEGRAKDPNAPGFAVRHRIRLVVQLVPERMPDEPYGWQTATTHTFAQRYRPNGGTVRIEVPCQIQGPVLFQKQLRLMSKYPFPHEALIRFADDLNNMRQQGFPDYRPLVSLVRLPYSAQSADTLSLLQGHLGVPAQDTPADPNLDWSLTDRLDSYQLFPGGKLYQAQPLSSPLQNVVLKPDPKNNPLGIFFHDGLLEIEGDVQLEGTLVVYGSTSGGVRVRGQNVVLQGARLPALLGSEEPVQLPVIISQDDVEILGGAGVEVNGLVYAGDRFRVRKADQDQLVFRSYGPICAQRLHIQMRTDWDRGKEEWQSLWESFTQSGSLFFPQWLHQTQGLDPQPQIVLSPAQSSIQFHWPTPQQPLFVPASSGQGLRWEVVRWEQFP